MAKGVVKVKKLVFFLLTAMCFCVAVNAQNTSLFSLSLTPGADIPLGPATDDGTILYTLGGSAVLSGEYTMPFASFLYAKGLVGYSMLSTIAQTSFSMISFGAGAGVRFSPFSKVDVKVSTAGGYSLGIYQDDIAGVFFFEGDAKVLYALSPSFSLGLGASYDHHRPFYNGVGVFLGVSFNLGAGQNRSKIDFIDIQLDPIFPVFYQYYDDNPLGRVVIKNTENGAIKDVKVSFFVQQYMDKPKVCMEIKEMKKNEEAEIPLFALFRNNILEITEGTKVTSQILIEYDYLDTVIAGETSQTVQMYHRNAMTWDDDRKAASFVTAKDPGILQLSKNIAGTLRDVGSQAVSRKFREAMGLFESLRQYGINYVIDPTTPYASLSEDVLSLDYLQFPIQTLSYKAGDCDDLSILYSAMLESIGIETAFITAPGHIYMAFGLDMPPEEAQQVFLRPEDLILKDDKTWVPVEITMIPDGFLKAWQSGAAEWRQTSQAGTAAFFPMSEAWKIYPPVGMIDSSIKIENPDAARILQSYSVDLLKFVEREISERVAKLQETIRRSDNKAKFINELGVLYARFGLYERARTEFEKASVMNYAPSLYNLGNIFYLENDFKKALKYYSDARKEYPDRMMVLAGIARAYYELDDFESIKPVYARMLEIDPDKAAEYSYLVSTTKESG